MFAAGVNQPKLWPGPGVAREWHRVDGDGGGRAKAEPVASPIAPNPGASLGAADSSVQLYGHPYARAMKYTRESGAGETDKFMQPRVDSPEISQPG